MAQQSITLANYSDIQQLQSNLATIEATSTASKAYVVGEYLVYNGQLYIVTAAIALGDTLAVGTNIESTSISDELEEKISTTGGRMDGGQLQLQSSNITSGTAPQTSTYGNSNIVFLDDPGTEIVGRVAPYFSSGGGQGFVFRSQRTIGTSLVVNQLGMYVDASGSSSVTLTQPVAWCEALNIGTRVYKEVGSSGTMAIPSGTATALTNISMTAGTWLVVGQVAFQGGSSATAGSYRRCHIGTSSTGAQIAAQAVPGVTAGNTQVQAIGIRVISSTQTTYLSCQQGSGSDISISKASSWIFAIKIGAQTS